MSTSKMDYQRSDNPRSRSNDAPPPLPPRAGSALLSPHSEAPPPYSEIESNHPYSSHALASNDPRSSSTQSLVPPEDVARQGRRKLLLIYVHGFMGTETSFQSFPAHVHSLVTITLSETHVVHTKIYPRYKSRRPIELVAEDFSSWLSPHETPDTDMILLGHSMGGLLAAEVILLPPRSPATGHALRHRILGTINFDVPFLGMHPGVVVSGIGSLFRPSPDPPKPQYSQSEHTPLTSPSSSTLQSQDYLTSDSGSGNGSLSPQRSNTLFSPQPTDPNYNPAFPNDINLPIRKGWNSALHFITKHSDGLRKASKQYVWSHIEFGGAMADYHKLKSRYHKIRALEEEDENARRRATNGPRPPPRVRFVNYYTASTGRPKRPKSPSGTPGPSNGIQGLPIEVEMQDMSLAPSSTRGSRSPSRSPRISLEEHREGEVVQKDIEESSESEYEMSHVEPLAMDDHSDTSPPSEPLQPQLSPSEFAPQPPTDPLSTSTTLSTVASLPPIPPLPEEPPFLDLSQYPDKDARKIAEKDHARALKAYKQAIKDRNAALKDRAKLEEKQARNARKEAERLQKEETREWEEDQAQRGRQQNATFNPSPDNPASNSTPTSSNPPHPAPSPPRPSTSAPDSYRPAAPQPPPQPQAKPKKPRDRKFCMLPHKDSRGQRDPTWIRMFMEGVDEVGAHCGLFFLDETYERLVGDVGARIEEWVREEGDWRVARGLGG